MNPPSIRPPTQPPLRRPPYRPAPRSPRPGLSSLLAYGVVLLHYLAGLGLIAVLGLYGAYVAAPYLPDYYSYWPNDLYRIAYPYEFLQITDYIDILAGLLVGAGVGLVLALPLFARAHLLLMYRGIEENTRQTRDLLFYLVNRTKQ